MSIVNATMSDQIAELRAEITRLRAGIEEYACTGTDHPCGCHTLLTADKAEIERLQFDCAMLRRADMGHQEEIAELREEIERLRHDRDLWQARCIGAIWLIPDEITYGELRGAAKQAAELRTNQQIQKDEPK